MSPWCPHRRRCPADVPVRLGVSNAVPVLANRERPDPAVLGSCWAALHDGEVIAHLWMATPPGTDRKAYREAAREALGHLGDLAAGEVVQLDDRWFFRRRTRARARRRDAPGLALTPFRFEPGRPASERVAASTDGRAHRPR